MLWAWLPFWSLRVCVGAPPESTTVPWVLRVVGWNQTDGRVVEVLQNDLVNPSGLLKRFLVSSCHVVEGMDRIALHENCKSIVYLKFLVTYLRRLDIWRLVLVRKNLSLEL